MVTELVILSPVILLYYFKFISVNTLIVFFFILYWLPKPLVISLLEFLAPYVATRNTASTNIALTFDDVPYGNHRDIIQLLDKYGHKGTLFVISGDVNDTVFEDLVMAVRNGHQLGNHGKTNSMHALKSSHALAEEVKHCDALITKIYNVAGIPLPSKMYYRPGCGAFHGKMRKIVEDMGYRIALGSVYPNDPVVRSSILNYYYVNAHVEAGDIVILHDRKWTPYMLNKLLYKLNDSGLRSVTLDSLL
ncbi:Polysaccharide deacetylase [Orpheovirus IHUMI-LCC2]|uniref:Polysaccharide deacetylase n=1 Tax=Orpheovirus IHUMI-LCC2 TaxID=2023057 RepID=A0A2I2L4G0_9VIRU|nr:Polysaccharide deacetylase [Orpheovirus IHUMI-LCC2]SNW62418.1 Polysaccharide deacetylase [Orpheovirus IHUMI-LCC2]